MPEHSGHDEGARSASVDDRLERYIAGELSASDRARLEREAEQDPVLAMALSAVTLQTDHVIEQGVVMVQERYRKVRREPVRARGRLPSVLSAAALSAAVALALTTWPVGPPLPAYDEIVVTHPALLGATALADLRAERVRSSHDLFHLEPSDIPVGKPRVLVHVDDWSWENRLDVRATVFRLGGIEVTGHVGTGRGDVPPGEHVLLVAVGPEWAWAPLFGPPGPSWQKFEVPYDLE